MPLPGGDELAQHRALAHDVRIGADIGGGGSVARQRPQVGQPAHLIEQSLALQVPGQGDGIAGLAALDQAGDGFENQPMIVAVEILGDDAVGDLVPGRGVQHQPAEHGLLRLDRMRRQAQAVAGAQGMIADANGHAQPLGDAIAGRYSSATIVTGKVTSTSVCKCNCT